MDELNLFNLSFSSQVIQYLTFKDLYLFTETTMHEDDTLFLGNDIIKAASPKSHSKNFHRIHDRMQKQGYATKVNLKGVKIKGISHASGIWMYNILGVFRVAFEYDQTDLQHFLFVHFSDLWLSTYNRPLLPENLTVFYKPPTAHIENSYLYSCNSKQGCSYNEFDTTVVGLNEEVVSEGNSQVIYSPGGVNNIMKSGECKSLNFKGTSDSGDHFHSNISTTSFNGTDCKNLPFRSEIKQSQGKNEDVLLKTDNFDLKNSDCGAQNIPLKQIGRISNVVIPSSSHISPRYVVHTENCGFSESVEYQDVKCLKQSSIKDISTTTATLGNHHNKTINKNDQCLYDSEYNNIIKDRKNYTENNMNTLIKGDSVDLMGPGECGVNVFDTEQTSHAKDVHKYNDNHRRIQTSTMVGEEQLIMQIMSLIETAINPTVIQCENMLDQCFDKSTSLRFDINSESQNILMSFILRILKVFGKLISREIWPLLSFIDTFMTRAYENSKENDEYINEFGIPRKKNQFLCFMSGYLGEELYNLRDVIMAKSEDFKQKHISCIDNLPPAKSVVNEIFPECMTRLFLSWMDGSILPNSSSDVKEGSQENDSPPSKVAKTETSMIKPSEMCDKLYPFIQLLLEFANNCLVSGVAHVVYPRLLYS